MGTAKAETGRPVRTLHDNPDMMGAHSKVEAVETEYRRVECLDQGTVSPVWSLATLRTVFTFVFCAPMADDCLHNG